MACAAKDVMNFANRMFAFDLARQRSFNESILATDGPNVCYTIEHDVRCLASL